MEQSALDIVLSFDDTGSMSSVRRQVRSQIQDLIKELFGLVPKLRIGVVIHNDYCDEDLIQKLELTSDRSEIISFINRDSSKGGGDYKEAYAFVLNQITKFDWRSDKKIVVMIGDAPPHEKGSVSAGITELYDWKEESCKLGECLIPIYAVQALGNRDATSFYEDMARFSNGVKLDLSQFGHISEYLLAIIHKHNNTLDAFQGSKPEYSTNISLKNMFSKLKGVSISTDGVDRGVVEAMGKYQVIDVYDKVKIKSFVEAMGLSYRAGRGFYQFITSEKIQKNKEVIFVDKRTGVTHFDTKWCRELMGIPLGTSGTVSPRKIPHIMDKYNVFIQSNSYTRDLDPGTKFLYELDKK